MPKRFRTETYLCGLRNKIINYFHWGKRDSKNHDFSLCLPTMHCYLTRLRLRKIRLELCNYSRPRPSESPKLLCLLGQHRKRRHLLWRTPAKFKASVYRRVCCIPTNKAGRIRYTFLWETCSVRHKKSSNKAHQITAIVAALAFWLSESLDLSPDGWILLAYFKTFHLSYILTTVSPLSSPPAFPPPPLYTHIHSFLQFLSERGRHPKKVNKAWLIEWR